MTYYCVYCSAQELPGAFSEMKPVICGKCGTRFFINQHGIYAYQFTTCLKDVTYYGAFHMRVPHNSCTVCSPSNPGCFCMGTWGDIVLVLKEYPDINPDNFAKRLPNLLVFL